MAETVGRYVLHESIARGGMATVHAARLTGAEGFNRLVAAKRLHPEFTEDPEFVTMFHDEAKIASRIHHPNVVPVLDVVVTESEVMLVQEYVHGVPLSVLMRRARQSLKPIPTPISVAIAVGILSGLHAAHEAKDDLGTPLDVIHRDVSPQNVMLSTEGVPRLLDFGIAKARTSSHQTRPGVVKGKLSYMAPEQIRVDPLTRRVDVYATGIVLWELLANRRIAEGRDEADFLTMLFEGAVPSLVEECSAWRRSMGQAGWKRLIALDAIVMKAISLKSGDRYATALDMAEAIVAAHPPATQGDVATWVAETAGDHLAKMRRSLAESEEEFRSVSRMEVATLSRRGNRTTADDSEADRVTVPMPEARLVEADAIDVTDIAEEEASSSSPPTSISTFSRATDLEIAERRPRVLPWLAAAVAIFAAAFLVSRPPSPSPAPPAAASPSPPPLPAALVEVPPTPLVAPSTTGATPSALGVAPSGFGVAPTTTVELPLISIPPAPSPTLPPTPTPVCAPAASTAAAPTPAPAPAAAAPAAPRPAPHVGWSPPPRAPAPPAPKHHPMIIR